MIAEMNSKPIEELSDSEQLHEAVRKLRHFATCVAQDISVLPQRAAREVLAMTEQASRLPQRSQSDLELAYQRYEALRLLSPREYGLLWQENLMTGVHFDTLVDRLVAKRVASRESKG